MSRSATAFLLLGPVLAIGLWPFRPLLLAIWPGPVEEIMIADGDWLFAPVLLGSVVVEADQVRARSRPVSLVEAHLGDGRLVHGYLIERSDSAGADGVMLLATGPETRQALPFDDLVMMFYPNDLSLAERFSLAMKRLKARQPLS